MKLFNIKKVNAKKPLKSQPKNAKKKFIFSRKQKITAAVVGVLVLSGIGYGVYAAYTMDEVSAGGCVSHTYRRGSSGSCVKHMQKMLNFTSTVGTIGVDGGFGPKTETKVKNFQKKYDLKKDGIVGKNTWNELCARTSAASAKKAAGCKMPASSKYNGGRVN